MCGGPLPADRGPGAGRARGAQRIASKGGGLANVRSKSFYVKAALHEYLTDLEDAYAADAAIDAFEAEGGPSRPLAAREAEIDR